MRAANPAMKPPAKGAAAEPPSTPQRWWQWVLVYPALAIAILTAAPTWIEKVKSVYLGIDQGSASDAEQQARLWRRNLSCAGAPFSWYSNPSNVKVDATICDSGDIFIRAATPSQGQFFKWVPLDDVVAVRKADGSPLESAAHAAILNAVVSGVSGPQSGSAALIKAQYQANVMCQRFVDGRMLVRRIQTPQGCFDEWVDTFNGRVVNRTPAPCVPQC